MPTVGLAASRAMERSASFAIATWVLRLKAWALCPAAERTATVEIEARTARDRRDARRDARLGLLRPRGSATVE